MKKEKKCDLTHFNFILNLVRKTQDKLHGMEQKLHDTESNQADRVDKSLLKNLLIGYIVAPNNDKSQILKLISSVLDFNQHESDKVGLNKGHTGWLNSILHGNDVTTGSSQSQNGKRSSSMLQTISSVLLTKMFSFLQQKITTKTA